MGQTITGARGIFVVNGEKIAFSNSVNYNIDQALTPVDVLDQLTPAEYAETGYTVDLSASGFRVYNQSPIQQGIQQKLENLLTQGELIIEIHDRLNPADPPLRVERCKMRNRSGNLDARGLWTETWSFVGIKASDEAGP